MRVETAEERLARVDMSGRVLLLSHCLRPSQTCPGKFDKRGLNCPEDCREDCVIARFRKAAREQGYKGVCVAAGGAMALRFVKDQLPEGIVAVACERELEEGVEGLNKLALDESLRPPVVLVPLTKDGCVDTEVDERQVLAAIALGNGNGKPANLEARGQS